MAKFMILAHFTDETAARFAARPATQSATAIHDALRELAAEATLGGVLEHLFFTAGEHDMVLVAEMPSQRKAVAYALAMTRMMGVRTRTVAAFEPAAMAGVIEDAAKVDGA